MSCAFQSGMSADITTSTSTKYSGPLCVMYQRQSIGVSGGGRGAKTRAGEGRRERAKGRRGEGEKSRREGQKREAHVVRADGVDLLDLVAERHRLVDDELQKLVRRGLAREQLELLVDRLPPEKHDAEGKLWWSRVSDLRGDVVGKVYAR